MGYPLISSDSSEVRYPLVPSDSSEVGYPLIPSDSSEAGYPLVPSDSYLDPLQRYLGRSFFWELTYPTSPWWFLDNAKRVQNQINVFFHESIVLFYFYFCKSNEYHIMINFCYSYSKVVVFIKKKIRVVFV